eukprot:218775_1
MLFIPLVGSVMFMFIFIIHGKTHFQLHVCCHSKRQLKCQCKVMPIDGAEFNFFPKSWHQYSAFNMFLCCIMIIIHVLDHSDPQQEIVSIPFMYAPKFNRQTTLLKSQSKNVIIIVFEYILIYGFMISLLWESLFSYY